MILAYFSFTNQADQWLADVTGALHHVKFEEVSATSLAVKRQYVAEPNGFDGWSGLSPIAKCHFSGIPGIPSGQQTNQKLLNMTIYTGFSHEQWWFSIYVNVYQRVYTV